MDYQYAINKYITITKEIGYIEKQIKNGDKDLSLIKKLKLKRNEQEKLKIEINKYNGV